MNVIDYSGWCHCQLEQKKKKKKKSGQKLGSEVKFEHVNFVIDRPGQLSSISRQWLLLRM